MMIRLIIDNVCLPKLSVTMVLSGSVKRQPPSLHSSLTLSSTAVMTPSMSSRVTLQFRSVTLAQAAVALSRAEVSSVCWSVE